MTWFVLFFPHSEYVFLLPLHLSLSPSRTYYTMHDSHIDLKFIRKKRAIYLCNHVLYTTLYYLTIYPFYPSHLYIQNTHEIHLNLFLDAQISESDVTNVKYSSKSNNKNSSSSSISMVVRRNLCKYDGRMFTLRYINSDVILIAKGFFATIELLRLI